MSNFFKICLAFIASLTVVSSMYAQATIEEVVVTAQRTEQSLQDVPIAVSAFTDEMLSDRQIEVASDIQLQVPGVGYSSNTFGTGGFSIRGITNLATAASADAGVEVHLNGLPLGTTSTNELGFMDMARIEVLRGPQGTLFGRNATGGVINLITARVDLDEFYGRARLQYGQDNEKQVDVMLNVPISDELGLRLAYNNFEKDGVNKNLYSKSVDPFDSRDSYQWRATLQWEPADDLTLTLIHNAYDEESSRTQTSGVWCQTGGNLVQGCVMGGEQVFQPVHPMSNGSTLPGLLGKTLGYYVPGNLTNGSVDEGKLYAPAGLPQDTGTVPQDFFQSNVWGSPTHDVQESTSQFIIDKDFDNGALTYSYNQNLRKFYRDDTSLSSEGSGLRWSAAVQALPIYNDGLPLGYSNSQKTGTTCDYRQFKAGSFCPGGAGINGYHVMPASGTAFHGKYSSTTHEVKFVSDLDGMFNFLIGAIDISNNTHSYYDVYASGITLNGLMLPELLAGQYREGYRGALACSGLSAPAGPCTAGAIATGKAILANPAIVSGAETLTGVIKKNGGSATVTPMSVAQNMVSRIDGLYTEFYKNVTDSFGLDSTSIFTEFYFDVNERNRLTLGLRYNEDTKSVSVQNMFYKVPLISNWDPARLGAGQLAAAGLGGTCGISLATGKDLSYETGGTDNLACFNSGIDADNPAVDTVGQKIGSVPGSGAANGSQPLAPLPAFNTDYTTYGISPIKDFSETTGRFVWDFQIDENTLFYASYSKGFKGGGFNPPFNADQFPDTPYTFESTGVDAIEFGVKATVPEVGLVANASIYYNDFDNFHIGAIRNETAINVGMPLENMGAELELYLAPPTVPGLTFNMMLNYATSEIGNFKMINAHDLGGHYRQQKSTGNMDGYEDWHVAKNFTANSFLVAKDALGTTYGRILDLQLGLAALGASATDADKATYLAGQRTTNEIAFAMTCSASAFDDCAKDAAGKDIEFTSGNLAGTFLPFESSAHAVGYGNLGTMCINIPGAINTCHPVALGGTAGLAPTTTQIYGGPTANGSGSAIPTGTLLPSIISRGTGASLQTGGACKAFLMMATYADKVTRANELSLAANERCASTVVDGKIVEGKFLRGGLEMDYTGNEMPFPELTLGFGIAYTFQTDNVEVTPRLDYYYQSDTFNSIANIPANKIKAWDEYNFSLIIVPTNGDWNIRFWGQNLTDDRNVTGAGIGNSSVGHTQSVFVREGRSFGMSFGLDF